MITVTIRELGGDRRTWRYRTELRREARAQAIRSHFGKRAWFWQDSGLPAGYGQVATPAGRNQHSTLTGRVRIDVEDDHAERD